MNKKFKIAGYHELYVELELPDGFDADHYNDSWHGDTVVIHIKILPAENRNEETKTQ